MKEIIAKLLKKAFKEKEINLNEKQIIKLLEIPPSSELGDYSFPCFSLASVLKKNPNQIAQEIKNRFPQSETIASIETKGPYVNFFLNKKYLAKMVIKEISIKKNKFGSSNLGKGSKTMIEFPSPNTNKPLHLGHLRNMSIGESVSKIFEFNQEKIIRANLNNDRGIHICKSMLAYKKYGKNKKPDKKTDHFVGDFYVKFNEAVKKEKGLEEEAYELLRKWEEGDKKTIELWKKMNKWALDGFQQTYKKFGINFDEEYYESEIYTKGKDIVLEGLKKKIFRKNSIGAIVFNMPENEKVLLRPDGTSVYITQDLYLAILKLKKFNLAKSIYVVGNEQNYHFDVLFSILDRLGYPKNKFIHLSYGMVNLPEGKMKSREGTVVDADYLIDEVQQLVKKELNSRYKLSKKEIESRSLKIALSAIKYFLLKIDAKKDMTFNPKESISFDGDTGPYILYSYARASSILRKAKKVQGKSEIKGELEGREFELIKKLLQFKEVVSNAYDNLNPSVIANYSYQLCQLFNEFYHSVQVINSDNEAFRLSIVNSFRQVLKNSLSLLGIETIEKM
jgi:arginyl-tRNA synthetase